MLLSKEEAKQILEKTLSYSNADACSVSLRGGKDGNIRYARNTVSTSGITSNFSLVINSSFGKKSGTVTLNELEENKIKDAVKRAEELAKLSPENPEWMPPLGPQTYDEAKTYFEETANIKPEFRANAAFNSISPAKEKNLISAGFLEDYVYFSSKINSEGLFAYNKSSGVDFTVTMRTEDGTGSGWVSRDYNDISKLDTAKASKIAIDKAVLSKQAKAIEPGKYTVILEPAASVGLIENMIYNMSARRADEGRSFLSQKGGGNRLGEQLLGENVTIYGDPLHPDLPTGTWNSSGLPIKKTMMFDKGAVKNMFYGRFWAKEKGVEPLPYPNGFIMEGGSATTQELIRSTKKGILLTRTWYIRSVDPQTLLYTGLTRDGTFYIENGEIKYPVKNFRFNESPVIMLNNVEALGIQERINGNLIPPMKINDFTFTSLSDAI